MSNLDKLSINTIRFLAIESIQKANSGHPGLPLGSAPMAYTLFNNEMSFNPNNPKWANRDRFILSAGHGSALLYALYHVFGMGVSIEDLKNFRQFKSPTAGHPEYGLIPATEVTTGPLGQGIAMGVGMALSESYLGSVFNKPDLSIVDHYTYVLCGDGCLMEGVSSEASSLAATMGLSKLIVLYDSNNITIEGNTSVAFTEDVRARYKAYGWQTLYVEDGNDIEAIDKAIKEAKADKERPTLIEVKTVIGYGSPNRQGTAKAHGEPLGAEEIKLVKEGLGWSYSEEFFVPNEVRAYMDEKIKSLEGLEANWNKVFSEYKAKYPKDAEKWDLWHSGKEGVDLINNEEFWKADKSCATRVSSEIILNRLADLVPNLIGGSADLGPSNKSVMKNRSYYSKDNRSGSNIHFGIREFAMICMANAMSLYGGLRPYIAGFFAFSDYMKSGLRIGALMGAPVISIFTHDSIGVGEDGPTHQPTDQLPMLRSIPNLNVWRPCDTRETAAAWCSAIGLNNRPTALVLSRQDLPLLEGTGKTALKGGYILRGAIDEKPDCIIIATGSEVGLACEAFETLKAKGIKARVISMPCIEVFEEQSEEYKNSVLPKDVRTRIAIEAGSSMGWYKYVGLDGCVISIDTFGDCGNASVLFKHFNITTDKIVNTALELLNK